jgi:hypothetical protein
LILYDAETERFGVGARVLQGSPLSPILFILYNSELFDLYRRPKGGLLSVGFADDLNILVYSDSTEANCRTLEQAHERCLEWSRRFSMKFAPKKYELIHFTTKRSRFNLAATI